MALCLRGWIRTVIWYSGRVLLRERLRRLQTPGFEPGFVSFRTASPYLSYYLPFQLCHDQLFPSTNFSPLARHFSILSRLLRKTGLQARVAAFSRHTAFLGPADYLKRTRANVAAFFAY